MAATVLNAPDLLDFDVIARAQPPRTGSAAPPCLVVDHPRAGRIAVRNSNFAHMEVLEMQWDITQDIVLADASPSDCISINFMLDGVLDSRFRGLDHELNMRAGTHNLIFTPDPGHTNWLPARQSMSTLLVSLKKDFFASAIGHNDAWSEQVLTHLDKNRAFSGPKINPVITPTMQYLINDIRNNPASGPMRNLLMQSRVLELVALEIEQFKAPVAKTEAIPAEEAEKLHQLKAYLDAHFLLDHSLAQLSRYCLLNEFKVKKGFKELFNTTVFNYLRKLRMEYAGQLLRNCALSVDEVADRLGYEHSQHFSIAFKKFTGVNPSQYQHSRSKPTATLQSFAVA